MGGGDGDVLTIFSVESFEVEGGRGGTFSVPADEGTMILGIFDLRDAGKEILRKRPSFSFRLGLVSVAFESITGLDSVLVVSVLVVAPLSPPGPGG